MERPVKNSMKLEPKSKEVNKMKNKSFWTIVIAVLAILLLAGLQGCKNSNNPYPSPAPGGGGGGGTNSVTIVDFAFQPNALTIDSGATVTWTNNSTYTTHTVTSNTGLFDQTLNTGATFKYTFNMKGTFGYHCKIHPTMTASITVK